jgi:hypothetical protein
MGEGDEGGREIDKHEREGEEREGERSYKPLSRGCGPIAQEP